MQITSISQQGNSSSIILPATLMKQAKWQRGQKMSIDYIPEADGVLIRRVKKSTAPKRSEKEFQTWLNNFLIEDADLLDELAQR